MIGSRTATLLMLAYGCLIASGLITMVGSARAQEAAPPTPPAAATTFTTPLDFAVLMDGETGAILFDKNGDKPMAPASMSKLMTLAVVFRALKEGRATFEDEFLVSDNAYTIGGERSGTASMLLQQGSRVKLLSLLLGIIIHSGNDACIVVAEGMAGTEPEFVKMMMAEAKLLGLTQSTFGNSTGLPHPDNLVTSRDLAKLARFLIKEYPDYYRSFAQPNFTNNTKVFINRNPLLTMKIGADGLKTGFTEESGYGIVGSAITGGRRLIAVVNGAKRQEDRATEARRMFEWGGKAFKDAEIFSAEDVVGEARVWGGTQYYVPLVGDGPVKIVVPRDSLQGRLKANIVYRGPLKPPIRKGEAVATLRVENSQGGVSEVPLYAGVAVERAGLFARGLDSIVLAAFGWTM
jgi:serine-type D-Ala-D-Ala carboxypeptidase (penicillin-binding protein 5/6)